MTTRIKANPLADQYESQHAAMLDEIHRLIARCFGGCVTMPQGLQFLRNGKPRRATDSECQFAEIWFPTELRFRLDKPAIAEEAAIQLEGFAHEMFEVAKAMRKNGEKIEGEPATLKVKTA